MSPQVSTFLRNKDKVRLDLLCKQHNMKPAELIRKIVLSYMDGKFDSSICKPLRDLQNQVSINETRLLNFLNSREKEVKSNEC